MDKKNLVPENGKRFSKNYQPDSESKSLGRKRKRIMRELASQIVTGESKKALQALADYLGVEIEEVDIELAMHLKQIEKVLKYGDTRAYVAVMNRLHGKPRQEVVEVSHNIPNREQITVKIINPTDRSSIND